MKFRQNLAPDERIFGRNFTPLLSQKDGYLVKIDFENLIDFLKDKNFEMVCSQEVGNFIPKNSVLARIYSSN